jgi:hypothetical protein
MNVCVRFWPTLFVLNLLKGCKIHAHIIFTIPFTPRAIVSWSFVYVSIAVLVKMCVYVCNLPQALLFTLFLCVQQRLRRQALLNSGQEGKSTEEEEKPVSGQFANNYCSGKLWATHAYL